MEEEEEAGGNHSEQRQRETNEIDVQSDHEEGDGEEDNGREEPHLLATERSRRTNDSSAFRQSPSLVLFLSFLLVRLLV